jgi:hypothetical protein
MTTSSDLLVDVDKLSSGVFFAKANRSQSKSSARDRLAEGSKTDEAARSEGTEGAGSETICPFALLARGGLAGFSSDGGARFLGGITPNPMGRCKRKRLRMIGADLKKFKNVC